MQFLQGNRNRREIRHVSTHVSVRYSVPVLPQIPPYPPPLIGEEDFEPYIMPLYLRAWGVYPNSTFVEKVLHTFP